MQRRRHQICVEIDGVSKNLTEWAEVAGVSRQVMSKRYNRGLRGEDLISPPNPNTGRPRRDYSFMIGRKYGKLKVFELPKYNEARCVCDCGKEATAKVYSILNGTTRSCGCLIGRPKKIE